MERWKTNKRVASVAVFFLCVGTWAASAEKEAKPKPKGEVTFFELYHKTAKETIDYLKDFHPEYVDQGMVRVVKKPTDRTLAIVADEKTTKKIHQVLSGFDEAGLKLEARTIKLKYAPPTVVLQAMGIAGVSQVWFCVSEHHTKQWKVGKQKYSFKTVAPKYTRWTPAQSQKPQGEVLPFIGLPEVPYVAEMPQTEPFEPPPITVNRSTAEKTKVTFPNTASAEDRNRLMVVGTKEDYERIKAFVQTVDRPAKQIMIECQIVELDANKVSDIGIDALQFGKRHSITNFNTVFPGEAIPQVGFPNNLLRPGHGNLPDATRQGIQYLFDDSSIDISGQFAGAIRAMVRSGDATVKARPKILTLDDRQNVLHIGKEIPTFDGTAVTQDTQQGNLVSTVNKVSKEYVGITLNLRPRVTGEEGQEVVMQMDIAVNELGERQRVFDEDLLGVPTVSVRRFTGQARVRNHRPIILGGLIRESEINSSHRVPILGEIPVLGRLFGRDYTEKGRTEIIMIITPHVLSENQPDPISMPRESAHFDTQDSVLFNDRYIIRGRDLIGVDHSTLEPVNNGKDHFTRKEVLDLSLLHIVKKRKLVQKLNVLDEYIPAKADSLSWWQRTWPDQTVRHWSAEDQKIYYEAAAYVIETIKNLNVDLTYEELVSPRREIVVPTSPHRVSLTYNKLKTYYERGTIALRGGGKLDNETMEYLKRASEEGRTLHDFARYVEKVGLTADAHGQFKDECLNLYQKLFPEEPNPADLEYGDFFKQLAKKGIDFMSIYTYFSENEERYLEIGKPTLGQLKVDLQAFTRMSISITEKGKRLYELEKKWEQFNAPVGA